MCIGLKVVACNVFLILAMLAVVGVLQDDDDEGVVVVAPPPMLGFGEEDHFFGRLALKMGVLVEA